MNLGQHRGGGVIAFSFIVALALQLVALPGWAETLRPDWLALVLIYWSMALPERVGVGIGWLTGLLLDVASGALLGQNALALAIVAYLVLQLHQRLRVFPLWQQSLSLLLLVALHLLLVLWIRGIIGLSIETWTYWLPAVSSLFAWPLVYAALRNLRRAYQVS